MRSLTLKLTLAFLFVSLIGAVLAAYFVQQRTQREFDRFLFDLDRSNIVGFLQTYYKNVGSWDQIQAHIPQIMSQENQRWTLERRLPLFTLVDKNGIIVFGYDRSGQKVVKDFEKGVPIEVEGEVVGYLIANRYPLRPGAESPEGAFLVSVNRAILTSALIAVVIALLLGAFLARTLTRPIRELTNATQVIAQGNLGYQVEVRSKDELGDLASSFNQMSADLAQSNQIRRQMTADIAHDLRTPMSVILGYTEALSDGKLAGSADIYRVMHKEADHLQILIDDLRTLSMADSGELPLNLQAVTPRSLLERTAAGMKPVADQKDIQINLEAGPDLPRILVDPERMARVLGNLASNALRYTPEGGLIELSALAKGSQVSLQVCDNGPGIAPADLPYIFHRFYRGSKSRQHNGEAGLGLTIAKSLVEAQGGTISVESELGKGATFTIQFPSIQQEKTRLD